MADDRSENIVRLISACQEPLYRYVFALLPNEQDARDVLQETCVALFRKADAYDEDKPFLPWAFRFAYLEVLKHRQKQRRHGHLLGEDVIKLLAEERDAQAEMLDARLRALENCLRELPAADFELIRGRYQSTLSIDELATQVEMSVRSVFRNLDRVRRLLANCITQRVAREEFA